jgi:hypothetical protein
MRVRDYPVYLKVTGGLIQGYRGKYKDKIPQPLRRCAGDHSIRWHPLRAGRGGTGAAGVQCGNGDDRRAF